VAHHGDPVAEAVRAGEERLDRILDRDLPSVTPETVIGDLFSEAAQSSAPLPVVGDDGRLVGVIPRVTLLNALGDGLGTAPQAPADEPEEVRL
jgi:glycine betaine/proline transport system ATP-binding protein